MDCFNKKVEDKPRVVNKNINSLFNENKMVSKVEDGTRLKIYNKVLRRNIKLTDKYSRGVLVGKVGSRLTLCNTTLQGSAKYNKFTEFILPKNIEIPRGSTINLPSDTKELNSCIHVFYKGGIHVPIVDVLNKSPNKSKLISLDTLKYNITEKINRLKKSACMGRDKLEELAVKSIGNGNINLDSYIKKVETFDIPMLNDILNFIDTLTGKTIDTNIDLKLSDNQYRIFVEKVLPCYKYKFLVDEEVDSCEELAFLRSVINDDTVNVSDRYKALFYYEEYKGGKVYGRVK